MPSKAGTHFAMDTAARDPGQSFAARSRSFDWTAPFAIAMVLLLAVLVLLPMFWLFVTSIRNEAKQFTLENYRQLFVDPSFLNPLLTTLWTSAAVGTLCVLA